MPNDHDTLCTRHIRQQIEQRRRIASRRQRTDRLRGNVQRSADDLGSFTGAGQRAAQQPVERHTEPPQSACANAHLLSAFGGEHTR